MKKNILITGGAGFLGFKYAEHFLKAGHKVICVDNNIKKINLLKKKNKKILFYNVDLSDENKIKNFYELITKKINIEVLINNASIDAIPKKKIKNRFPNASEWDIELNVGLRASFLMIKYFGEKMKSLKRGKIINIGSDLSVIAPNQKIYKSYNNYIKPVTYSVIKHGMVGLTKYFASLYGADNVQVNMISPGPVKNNQSSELVSEIKALTPLNRLANPEDLFSSLDFIIDDNSSFITGQNIIIDGGRTIL